MQIITKKQFNKRISQTKKSFYSRLDKNLSFNDTAPTALNPHSAIAFFVKTKINFVTSPDFCRFVGI